MVLARAAAGDDDAETPKPDIDQLAAFLSAKAVEMRASFDEQDLPLIGLDAEAAEADSDMPSAADIVRAFASADEAVPAGPGLPGEIVSAVACWGNGSTGVNYTWNVMHLPYLSCWFLDRQHRLRRVHSPAQLVLRSG